MLKQGDKKRLKKYRFSGVKKEETKKTNKIIRRQRRRKNKKTKEINKGQKQKNKKKNKRKTRMRRPGLEPGPPPWQGSILAIRLPAR